MVAASSRSTVLGRKITRHNPIRRQGTLLSEWCTDHNIVDVWVKVPNDNRVGLELRQGGIEQCEAP
jgi:hypothetical protein